MCPLARPLIPVLLALTTATAAIAAPPVEGGAGAAPPEPAAATTAAAAPDGPSRRTAVAPSQAVLDKLGLGDRLSLAGDQRAALFAYQDAVYAQPTYAPARVRLGRAYLALRYPAQAIAQAEAALAVDPGSAEARTLLQEARGAAPRSGPGAATAAPPPAAAPAAAAPASTAAPGPGAVAGGVAAAGASVPPRPGARTYKLTPEAGAQGASHPAAPPGTAGAAEPVSQAQRQVAAQHYRAALGFLGDRDWVRASAALSEAILADPTLAVAYSARGSARYGLGKYREAAEDYGAAMRLDPKLGTPVYGLAECHRALGEGKKAAELYERYAGSTAADVRDDLRALAAKRARELR